MKIFATATLLLAGFALRANATPVDIQVVGPDKAPVTEAQVMVFDYANKKTFVEKTDETGHVHADLSRIEDGRLGDITIAAKGFGVAFSDVRGANLTIKLEREKYVAGEVRDATGQPVEGATVRIYSVTIGNVQHPIFAPLAEAFTARTQGDGSWIIGGLPASTQVVAVLDDAAYVFDVVKTPLSALAISEAPPLTARPGASLVGRVLDEAGRGVAEIEVSTMYISRALGSWHSSKARSDADGFYRVDSLPAGTYAFTVEDALDQRVAKALEKQTLEAGEAQNHDFKLEQALFISGTVVDEATGKPLQDVSVYSSGPHNPRSAAREVKDQTDEKGHYRLPAISGTNWLYLSGKRGYPASNIEVEVSADQNKTVDFALRKGLSLSGTTVDAKGEPLPGVFLFVTSKNGERTGVTSDGQGRWEALGLAAGPLTIQPSAEWDIISPTGDLPKTITTAGGKITFDVLHITLDIPRTSSVEVPIRAIKRQAR